MSAYEEPVKEVEVDVSKEQWVIVLVILAALAFSKAVRACQTTTVYLPDGKVQVCQVCKDVVICY